MLLYTYFILEGFRLLFFYLIKLCEMFFSSFQTTVITLPFAVVTVSLLHEKRMVVGNVSFR